MSLGAVALFMAIPTMAANKASVVVQPATVSKSGSSAEWKSTALVKSHKEYWFVKSAVIADSPSRRTCKEDKSKGKKDSKALLANIELKYPMPRRGNGDFDYVIKAGNVAGVKLSKCTYTANITYSHGSKKFKTKATFVLNLTPGATPVVAKKVTPKAVVPKPVAKPVVPAKPIKVVKKPVEAKKKEVKAKVEAKKSALKSLVPKKVIPTPVVAKKEEPKKVIPAPVVKKEKPKKVFQAEDMKAPEKVVVSEEAKVAMVQPKAVKPKTSKVTPKSSSSSALDEGLKAYRAAEFEKAAKIFLRVPKPTSRQKGNPEREAYVKANLYRGLAAQQLGSLKVAITSYQTVLKYEKYYPHVNMNIGICYMEMRQFGKATRSFRNVVRDQNKIPPEQFDDVMQRTRYFSALTWTRMFKLSKNTDRKIFYKRTAKSKWMEYNTWFGDVAKYKVQNENAVNYLDFLEE